MTDGPLRTVSHAPWRVRDRDTFLALEQTPRCARRGGVTVRFVPGMSGTSCAVAYAINRRVGNAVTRNRVRRRLRSAMASLSPPSGAYLVRAAPRSASTPYAVLAHDLARALEAVVEGSEP